MIISHKHKFIFVAIPKTGTHALRFALRPHLHVGDWEQVGLFKSSQLPIPELAKKKHGHITASEIKNQISEERWNSYFKFSIVRNPWDRFISYCFFKMKNKVNAFSKNPLPFMKLLITHDKHFKTDLWSKSQHKFITDKNGDSSINLLLRQESLQADYDLLVNKLNIQSSILETINTSPHSNYRDYYDDELKEMVGDYYQKDIELLNYTF